MESILDCSIAALLSLLHMNKQLSSLLSKHSKVYLFTLHTLQTINLFTAFCDDKTKSNSNTVSGVQNACVGIPHVGWQNLQNQYFITAGNRKIEQNLVLNKQLDRSSFANNRLFLRTSSYKCSSYRKYDNMMIMDYQSSSRTSRRYWNIQ